VTSWLDLTEVGIQIQLTATRVEKLAIFLFVRFPHSISPQKKISQKSTSSFRPDSKQKKKKKKKKAQYFKCPPASL
jgi:hypothetical protein